jgi:hypothetical protein
MFASALPTVVVVVEKERHLPLPPWGFAAIALLIFFLLFAFTWSFRSVGNRH